MAVYCMIFVIAEDTTVSICGSCGVCLKPIIAKKRHNRVREPLGRTMWSLELNQYVGIPTRFRPNFARILRMRDWQPSLRTSLRWLPAMRGQREHRQIVQESVRNQPRRNPRRTPHAEPSVGVKDQESLKIPTYHVLVQAKSRFRMKDLMSGEQ